MTTGKIEFSLNNYITNAYNEFPDYFFQNLKNILTTFIPYSFIFHRFPLLVIISVFLVIHKILLWAMGKIAE